MNEYERFKNLIEDENYYILIDDELYLVEKEESYIELTSFEDEKIFNITKDNLKKITQTKKILIVIIEESNLVAYLEGKNEFLNYESKPIEFNYQETEEQPDEPYQLDDEPDIFTEIVQIDIENLIKIDLEIKERILSEWERTYSDLEYLDSIENNYKNIFPKMNEYQTYDKSMKLLNFIYKKTKINRFNNYLSKQDVIIKQDEDGTYNYHDAYKYIRNELYKITGASFTPYNFTENNKKLVILINGNKQEIILNENIQSVEQAVSILNTKLQDVLCIQYDRNIQIQVKKDKILSLSNESDSEAIQLFGKLICYKPIIKDILNNDFTQSYLIPIIEDQKKFYGDPSILYEEDQTSAYININDTELKVIDAERKKTILQNYLFNYNQPYSDKYENLYGQNEDLDYIINKPFINKTPTLDYYKIEKITYDLRAIRYPDKYIDKLNEAPKITDKYEDRYIEGEILHVFDDINFDIDSTNKSTQTCNGTQSDKTFKSSTYNKTFNSSPFFAKGHRFFESSAASNSDIMNIVGFYKNDNFIPDFCSTSIPSFKKKRPIQQVIDESYSELLKINNFKLQRNIGYNIFDQVLNNINNQKKCYSIEKTGLKNLINQDTKNSLNDMQFFNYLDTISHSLQNVFEIEDFSNACNLTLINKILQKYNFSTNDIDSTKRYLIKNIIINNRSRILTHKNSFEFQKKYMKNVKSKTVAFDEDIEKKILFNLSKKNSVDIIIDEVDLIYKNYFTSNELDNYLINNKIEYNPLEITVVKDKLKKIIDYKINKIGYLFTNELFHIYIGKLIKKKMTFKRNQLVEIFNIYNINFEKFKTKNTIIVNNLSNFEMFIHKLQHELTKTYDGGHLFNKYLENDFLNQQIKYYNSYTDEKLTSEITRIEVQLTLIREQFERDRENYHTFIEKCGSFKIKKVYGKKTDLIHDSAFVKIYYDSNFDDLHYNKQLIDKSENPMDMLRKLYIYDTDEELEKKKEEIDSCVECRRIIQEDDYAILLNMGSRLDLGTKVNMIGDDQEFFIIGANYNGSYILKNKNNEIDTRFEIQSKKIENYEQLCNDGSSLKRVLYQRKNNIWVPLTKEQVEESNACLLEKFQLNLLNKSWDYIKEKYIESDLKINCEDGELDESGICVPKKFKEYIDNIKLLENELLNVKSIELLKSELSSSLKANKLYINREIKNKSIFKKRKEEEKDKLLDESTQSHLTFSETSLKKSYNKIFEIQDFDERLDKLQLFIDNYGRLASPEKDENPNFIYWKGNNIKLCCVHHLDLINITDSVDRQEFIDDFLHKYSVNNSSTTIEFSDDTGIYCKYCSEKLDELTDSNYINPFDIENEQIEYNDVYSKKEQKIINDIEGKIQLCFGNDIYNNLKRDDLLFMIKELIEIEDKKIDVDLTSFLTYKSKDSIINQTFDDFNKSIIKSCVNSQSNLAKCYSLFKIDKDEDKDNYTYKLKQFQEKFKGSLNDDIINEYIASNKILDKDEIQRSKDFYDAQSKDKSLPLETQTELLLRFFIFRLWDMKLNKETRLSQKMKEKIKSIKDKAQLSVIIFTLITSIPEYRTRTNVKFKLDLDSLSGIIDHINFIFEKKEILTSKDIEDLYIKYNDRYSLKLEYENIKASNEKFKAEWNEFRPKLYDEIILIPRENMKRVREDSIIYDTFLAKNFELLDYMNYEYTDIDKEFKKINMIKITNDFTDNDRIIGKKRYFSLIVDKDINLLENLPNDESREETLKYRLVERYKDYEVNDLFINKKVELLLPPLNGKYYKDMISHEFKHNIEEDINRFINTLSPDEKKDKIQKYLSTGYSNFKEYSRNDLPEWYEPDKNLYENIYQKLLEIKEIDVEFNEEIFNILSEKETIPTDLESIEPMNIESKIDEIENIIKIQLNIQNYSIDSLEYDNELDIQKQQYINKIFSKNKYLYFNLIKHIINVLNIYNNDPIVSILKSKYYVNCINVPGNKIISGLIKCDSTPYFKKNGENYWTYIHDPKNEIFKSLEFLKNDNVKYSPYEENTDRYVFSLGNKLEKDTVLKLQNIAEIIKLIEKIQIPINDYDKFISLLEFLLKYLCNLTDKLIDLSVKKIIFEDLISIFSYINDDLELVSTQIDKINADKNEDRYQKLSSLDNEDEKGNNDMLTREAYRSLNLGAIFDNNHPSINTDADKATNVLENLENETVENENVEGDLFNDEIDQNDYSNDFEAADDI